MSGRRLGRLAWVLVALVLVGAVVCGCGGAKKETTKKLSFSIATGGVGGVWYPLGGAIGGIIAKYVPDAEATAEATTAGIDNLKLLTAQKAGMGFCYDYQVVWVNEGRQGGVPGKHPVRLVMGFYEQPLHLVTKEGSGIKSLMDLKGKRVSTCAPNSGTEEQAGFVLKALGIDWDKDFAREKLGVSESVAALKDGKIDAFFWSGAVPTSAVIDLASTPGLKMVLVPITGEIADRIMQANPGVFHKTVFSKGCYPGLEGDVETIAITAVLATMESFPADKLYQIVDAIFAHKSELTAVWKGAEKLTPEKAIRQVSADALKYLHPGAEKYFKEKGVLK